MLGIEFVFPHNTVIITIARYCFLFFSIDLVLTQEILEVVFNLLVPRDFLIAIFYTVSHVCISNVQINTGGSYLLLKFILRLIKYLIQYVFYIYTL
jgi:hypothetical protein